MKPQLRHLLLLLLCFGLTAIPSESLRREAAQAYAQTGNFLVFERFSLGREGQMKLVADQQKHEGTMSQDAALHLGTRRKPNLAVFGVNIRRDALLPLLLCALVALCAPTHWSIRLKATALSFSLMGLLTLISFRAIAAWYFVVHGQKTLVYRNDPSVAKFAQLLYKGILSQPNYRLALALALGALGLWIFGYHCVRGENIDSPLASWKERLRSRLKRG